MCAADACGVIASALWLVQTAGSSRLLPWSTRPQTSSASSWASAGDRTSYGIDDTDLFRRATTHVDRILKGEKPADLPAQLPTKFDLAVNLKTAKALGLSVPPNFARYRRRGHRIAVPLFAMRESPTLTRSRPRGLGQRSTVAKSLSYPPTDLRAPAPTWIRRS
jgi:hypothetical protein